MPRRRRGAIELDEAPAPVKEATPPQHTDDGEPPYAQHYIACPMCGLQAETKFLAAGPHVPSYRVKRFGGYARLVWYDPEPITNEERHALRRLAVQVLQELDAMDPSELSQGRQSLLTAEGLPDAHLVRIIPSAPERPRKLAPLPATGGQLAIFTARMRSLAVFLRQVLASTPTRQDVERYEDLHRQLTDQMLDAQERLRPRTAAYRQLNGMVQRLTLMFPHLEEAQQAVEQDRPELLRAALESSLDCCGLEDGG